MKVKIKKYPQFFGPFQLVDTIFFWAKDEEWVFNLGQKLADTYFGESLVKLSNWYVDYKDNRRCEVKIHNYDTWAADDTLARIILPTLERISELKHSAPCVDDEDVPENIRMSSDTEYDPTINGTTDKYHFERWDWVLSEMIYAFRTKITMNDDSNFYDKNEDDYKRMKNGFILFGKYYENLWT